MNYFLRLESDLKPLYKPIFPVLDLRKTESSLAAPVPEPMLSASLCARLTVSDLNSDLTLSNAAKYLMFVIFG